MKKLFLAISLIVAALGLAACEREADVASRNISAAADEFQIVRRIVVINTWTDNFLLEIIGRCSLGNQDGQGQRTITCKHGHGQYKKHFTGLGANVTYFVEQLDAANVSGDYYKVNIKPTVLIPNLSLNK